VRIFQFHTFYIRHREKLFVGRNSSLHTRGRLDYRATLTSWCLAIYDKCVNLQNRLRLGSQFGFVGHVNDALPLSDVEGARATQGESYRGMRFRAGFCHAKVPRWNSCNLHTRWIWRRLSCYDGRRCCGRRDLMHRSRKSYIDVHLKEDIKNMNMDQGTLVHIRKIFKKFYILLFCSRCYFVYLNVFVIYLRIIIAYSLLLACLSLHFSKIFMMLPLSCSMSVILANVSIGS